MDQVYAGSEQGGKGPLVSLVVATVGRSVELDRFLAHVGKQTYQHLEVIVVDQNTDDRVRRVLDSYCNRICIIHVHSAKGASKARNIGLKLSRGDIVAFPDDDCWYPPDLLASVVRFFELRRNWGGLTGRIMNEIGKVSGNARFDSIAGPIDLSNIWRRACAATLFLTRETVVHTGGFDEELGPGAGTPWGAAEDIEYPARAIKAGNPIFYDPSICVFHPDSPVEASAAGAARAYTYGAGIGRVWMKHKFPYSVIVRYLIRPLTGAFLSMITGHWGEARCRWAAFEGRLSGLMSR